MITIQQQYKQFVSLQSLHLRGHDQFNTIMGDINIWVHHNLQHLVDYEWSLGSFTRIDKSGTHEYPNGLWFYKEEDLTAFKLKFRI